MKEIKPIDIELAVRSLGLPFSYQIESAVSYFARTCTGDITESVFTEPAIMTMTFSFTLTPEIKAYLPEMKSRYDIWVSLRNQMETGLSALDN